MKKIKIYALCEPGTEVIRYVGKTKEVLKKRLAAHIRDNKRPNHKTNWIKSVIAKGHTPSIIELDECDESIWEETEIYWIAQCRAWGFNLTNFLEGGNNKSFENLKKTAKLLKEVNQLKTVVYNVEGEYFKEFKGLSDLQKYIGISDVCYRRILKDKKENIVNGYIIGKSKEDCLSKLDKAVVRPQKAKAKQFYSLNINTMEFMFHNSIGECGRYFKTDDTYRIAQILQRQKGMNVCRLNTFGYTKEECLRNLEEYRNMKKQQVVYIPKSTKKVICIETKEEFESVKEAAIKFNTDPSSISACCRGRLKTTAKHSFKYL